MSLRRRMSRSDDRRRIRWKRLCLPVAVAVLLAASPRTASPDIKVSAPERPTLTFAVISDIHVQSWNRAAIRKFEAALSDLSKAAPQAQVLVLNGDLGDGHPDDYRTLQSLLAARPHPPNVFCTIGNHEFYMAWHNVRRQWSDESFPNGETEAASIRRFLQFVREPRVYYRKEVAGYPFIFLGMERYRQSDPSLHEDAYLSPEQLRWLGKTLAGAARSGRRPMFVFLHQPLPGPSSAERGVVPADALKTELASAPGVILFTGHTHRELRLGASETGRPESLGFAAFNSSSAASPWPGSGKSEGLIVEVYPSEVVVKGRDFARRRWIPEARYSVKY